VELPEEVVDDLRKRLRRAGGQVQAVEKMLAEGRECRDIVTQLSAAINALEQTGFRLIATGLTYCIEHPTRRRRPATPSTRCSACSRSWPDQRPGRLGSGGLGGTPGGDAAVEVAGLQAELVQQLGGGVTALADLTEHQERPGTE